MNAHDHEQVSEHGHSESYRERHSGRAVPSLQRQAGNTAIADLVRESTSGAGRPLEEGVREEMEGYFGQPFDGVRVHTGPTADRSARSLHAHAYTVGSDIVFRDGAYDPDGSEGKHRLAHELTHVVQQHSGRIKVSPLADVRVSRPDDPLEREADRVASRIVAPMAESVRPAGATDGILEGLFIAPGRKPDADWQLGDGGATSWVARPRATIQRQGPPWEFVDSSGDHTTSRESMRILREEPWSANDLVSLFIDSYRPNLAARLSTVRYGNDQRAVNYQLPRAFLAAHRELLIASLRLQVDKLVEQGRIDELRRINEQAVSFGTPVALLRLQRLLAPELESTESALSGLIGSFESQLRSFISGPLVAHWKEIPYRYRHANFGVPEAASVNEMGTGANLYLRNILSLAYRGRVRSPVGRAGRYRELARRHATEHFNNLVNGPLLSRPGWGVLRAIPGQPSSLLFRGWYDLRDRLVPAAREELARSYRSIGMEDGSALGVGQYTVEGLAEATIDSPGPQ